MIPGWSAARGHGGSGGADAAVEGRSSSTDAGAETLEYQATAKIVHVGEGAGRSVAPRPAIYGGGWVVYHSLAVRVASGLLLRVRTHPLNGARLHAGPRQHAPGVGLGGLISEIR